MLVFFLCHADGNGLLRSFILRGEGVIQSSVWQMQTRLLCVWEQILARDARWELDLTLGGELTTPVKPR